MRAPLSSEQGAIAAEFALVVPALLLFLMGIMDAGRIFNAWMVLTNGTRNAARYGVAGIRDGDSNLASEVQSFAVTEMGQLLDATALSVVVTPQASNGMTTSVTVSAVYQVAMTTPFMQVALGTVPVSVQSVMRAE
ncbi:MAG: pilus assembly protein [Chloroflexota bacterium]|nr:pilus assembly protein [Chloroflexota bacterium]